MFKPNVCSYFASVALLAGVMLGESPELPAGPMQQKARAACNECHDSSLIVQQRLGRPAWVKEVDKMIKWGAVVDSKDHDALVDYFSTNYGPDQPPYALARSATTKDGRRK